MQVALASSRLTEAHVMQEEIKKMFPRKQEVEIPEKSHRELAQKRHRRNFWQGVYITMYTNYYFLCSALVLKNQLDTVIQYFRGLHIGGDHSVGD